MNQHMRNRLLQQFQPIGNQFRTYPLQPPMLPSQNANKWRNRENCNGFPWAPSTIPNAQMGYQSYPAVGQDYYSLPRQRTASMQAQLPTPPMGPLEDFLVGNPNPALPMPQATFYHPKNKYMETENLFTYKDTLLTRREVCLLVALERYLHLDHDTSTGELLSRCLNFQACPRAILTLRNHRDTAIPPSRLRHPHRPQWLHQLGARVPCRHTRAQFSDRA